MYYESIGKYILLTAKKKFNHDIMKIMKGTKIPLPILKSYIIDNVEIHEAHVKIIAKYLDEDLNVFKAKSKKIKKYGVL